MQCVLFIFQIYKQKSVLFKDRKNPNRSADDINRVFPKRISFTEKKPKYQFLLFFFYVEI